MKCLENLIALNSKVTVYVPSTVDVDKAIDNKAQVEKVARCLSDSFGGATASPVQGYWVASNGDLVVENTTMVFAYCTTDGATEHMPKIIRLCRELKRDMNQEAIAMEYNGQMYFI